jgi:molybdate transport system substrate-binding protein
MKPWKLAAMIGALLTTAFSSAEAGQTNVAVAANFTEPGKEIAALFKQRTGNDAILSFGASGQFLAQIKNGAPFQVFLSAEADRPQAAIEAGYAVPGTVFTYAIGKLVLWSPILDVTNGEEALKAGAFTHLAIANPNAAPHGAAAIETMKALGVYDALAARIVQGSSIAQAFQFVDTKNAEIGFVALSQLKATTAGTRWLVPQNLYTPIRQDAVLLKKGENDDASKAFLEFLRGPEARGIIEKYGYGHD